MDQPQPLTKKILAEVFTELGLLSWSLSRPANFRYEYFEGGLSSEAWEALRQNKKRKQALAGLRHRHWLTTRKAGKEMIVRLSSDALVGGLKQRIQALKKHLPHKQRCLVVFDFPVGVNDARQFWRRFLSSSGFRFEQLSVWITEKDVVSEMRALIRLLGVERWVKLYLVLEK